MSFWKKAAIFAALIVGSIGLIVVAAMFISLEEQEAEFWLLMAYIIVVLCVCTWGTQAAVPPGKPGELRMRLFTHTIVSYAAAWIALACAAAGGGFAVALGASLGFYLLVYYVLGAVQLPLNIAYRRLGYSPRYSLFYPLLGKRRREMLLFGTEEEERFAFDANGVRGECSTEFFFVQGRKYGQVELPDQYLFSEFPLPQKGWTGKDFDAYAACARKKGFLAVGWRIAQTKGAGEAVRLIAIPDLKNYKKGKEALAAFFARRKIGTEIFPVDYRSMEEDVLPELLPYRFNSEQLDMEVGKPFDDERVGFLGAALVAMYREPLLARVGAYAPTFFVGFPEGTGVEEMKRFAAAREKEGFLCIGVISTDTEEKTGAFPVEKGRSNYVYFEKLISFNPDLSPAQLLLGWALSVYRQVYHMTWAEYLANAGLPKAAEEDKKELAAAERLISVTLHGIGPAPEEADDLMFSGDMKFAYRDFLDAGLMWISDRRRWMVRTPNAAVERAFGLLAQLPDRIKASVLSETELTQALRGLYDAAKEAGALRIGWRF